MKEKAIKDYVIFTNSCCDISPGILAKRHGVELALISQIGSVIRSYAGPGTIALFFVGKHR